MDDSYLQGDSVSSCPLGFNTNERKSVLTPTQRLGFLGFIINSTDTTITLTPRRKSNIAEVCTKLLLQTRQKIRFVSSGIGMIIAALAAVRHGALHYRTMEADENSALRGIGGDFENLMTLSPKAGREVQWWITHTTGAPWKDTDDLLHINVLELTDACFALSKLATTARSTHIRLKLDNLTALAYINKMGGTHSPECYHVTPQIWKWAIARAIWLSAAYIPGDSNVVADFHSRCFHENKEWALNDTVFALLATT